MIYLRAKDYAIKKFIERYDSQIFTDFNERRPSPEDFCVNIQDGSEKVILYNKIGKNCPDMLFDHSFSEASTESLLVCELYHQALGLFIKHRIFFLEYGGEDFEEIFNFLDRIMEEEDSLPKSILNLDELAEISAMAENLKLSVTMEKELLRLCKYLKLEKGSLADLDEYKSIRVRTKNEGKIVFGRIVQ